MTWVVVFNDIDSKSLFETHETIEGKTTKDALEKRFNKQFNRLTGDMGRYANIILVKGKMEGKNLRYTGRYQLLCYGTN